MTIRIAAAVVGVMSPDGQSLIALRDAGSPSGALELVSNWFEVLKARVPAP